MRNMRLRLQTAMEYLMDYSWAILVIAMVVFTLYVFGFFNTTMNQCSLGSGLSCQDEYLAPNGILTVTILQETGSQINVTGIACAEGNSSVKFQSVEDIQDSGTSHTYSVQCYTSSGVAYSSTTGTVFKGSVDMKYEAPYTGYVHTVYGIVETPVSSSAPGLTVSSTTILTTSQITVTFSLTAGNSITSGTSDNAVGTTSASGDTVALVYCAGTCTLNSGSTRLITDPQGATYNVGSLPVGTYTITACDITADVCASPLPQTLTISSTPIETYLSLESSTDTNGASDIATGYTSTSGHTVAIYYCAGTCTTPSTELAQANTPVTYNVGSLPVGSYTLDACDTTAGGCSTTNALTITSGTGVTLNIQSETDLSGNTDTATAVTDSAGHIVQINYCAGTSCPSEISTWSTLVTGTSNTVTYNVGTLGVGVWTLAAIDKQSGLTSPSETVYITSSAVSLSLQSANDVQGTSDNAIGTTTTSGDTVGIYYCNGTCTPSTSSSPLSSASTVTTYNVGTLAAGTYTLEACDTTDMVCSPTDALTITNTITSGPPEVTLSIPYNSIVQYKVGTGEVYIDDPANAVTSHSQDTVGIYYCSPAPCTPSASSTFLASNTGFAQYNVASLNPDSTYTFIACDTTYNSNSPVCSGTSTVTVNPVVVTFTVQNVIDDEGVTDNAVGGTNVTGDNVEVLYCGGTKCNPISGCGIAFGPANAICNLGTFAPGTYNLTAEDLYAYTESRTSNIITILSSGASANVLLTVQNEITTTGQTDNAVGTTLISSSDNIKIYYCYGVCTPTMSSNMLSSGTGTTTANVETLESEDTGIYTLIACDTVADQCSGTQEIEPTSTVTLTVQDTTDPYGTTDNAVAIASIQTDTVEIIYCAGATCQPNNVYLGPGGEGTATGNVGELDPGVYTMLGEDIHTFVQSNSVVVHITSTTPPSVTQSLEYNSVAYGASDELTDTTSYEGDDVSVYYCAWSGSTPCTPTVSSQDLLDSAEMLAEQNVAGVLESYNAPAGTYTFEGCDTTYSPVQCSSTNTMTLNSISSTPTVTLSLQYATDSSGTSDNAVGITSVSGDTIKIYDCAGTCSSPSGQLAIGTGNTIDNVGALPVGTYTLDACDVSASPSVCSSPVNTLTITSSSSTPSLTLQSNAIVEGTSDNAIGTSTVSGHTMAIYYCPGSCTSPSTQLAEGNTPVTYNIGKSSLFTPGTYTIDACDLTQSACSATNTVTVTSSPPIVTLALQSNTITEGAADNAIGTTTYSSDQIVLNYCAGPSCTSWSNLASNTGTVEYNVGNIMGAGTGTYTFEACDTVYSVCATNTLVINPT